MAQVQVCTLPLPSYRAHDVQSTYRRVLYSTTCARRCAGYTLLPAFHTAPAAHPAALRSPMHNTALATPMVRMVHLVAYYAPQGY